MTTENPNLHTGHAGSVGTTGAAPTAGAEDSSSIGSLLRQLARDVPDLVVKELALARAEMGENLRRTKAGVASVASGGGVLFAGFIVLLMSAVYGLATELPLWLSALIVGGIVTIIGFAMVAGGKKKLEPEALKPDRTINQLQKDSQALKGRTA